LPQVGRNTTSGVTWNGSRVIVNRRESTYAASD